MEKGLHLPPHRRDRRCIDSLAQQVEHIPFKDGVLGSSPRRITGIQMNKKAKAFHSWTDPQWKAFFRVFSFMSSFSCLDARGPTGAGEVWPGTRQTWLASLTPLDARKGSEKKIKASPRPGKFGRVSGKFGWRPRRPPRVSRPACDFEGTFGGTRPRLAGIWRASRRRGSS